MPQTYKRKTSRGSDVEVLRQAAAVVESGRSFRAAAKDFKISRTTLKRYIDRSKANPSGMIGYKNCKLRHMIFSEKMESELAERIKTLGTNFHRLSKNKCLKLAYEFACKNHIKVPEKWKVEQKAGQSFWFGFKKRHNLAIHSPQATSLRHAFSRHTVSQFFHNLSEILDGHKFKAEDIYNVGETECSTVRKLGSIAAERGPKTIRSVTSAEGGQLVTVINTISAAGFALPPFLIFPCENYHNHFIKGAPCGSDGSATESGLVTEDTFLKYLDHMIKHTCCSVDKKKLLILDNHEAHISLAIADKAKANGIVLFIIPPHTSHKLQPLECAVHGPYKMAYAHAMDIWMKSNPDKTLSIYDIPQLVNEAHVLVCVLPNIISGFQSTGIHPFNSSIFSDEDFAPDSVTDIAYYTGLSETPNENLTKLITNSDAPTVPQITVPTTADVQNQMRFRSVSDIENTVPGASTSEAEDCCHVSPHAKRRHSNAAPWKINAVNRRKRATKRLTRTPDLETASARSKSKDDDDDDIISGYPFLELTHDKSVVPVPEYWVKLKNCRTGMLMADEVALTSTFETDDDACSTRKRPWRSSASDDEYYSEDSVTLESVTSLQPLGPSIIHEETEANPECKDPKEQVLSLLHQIIENQTALQKSFERLNESSHESIVCEAKSLVDLDVTLQRIKTQPNCKQKLSETSISCAQTSSTTEQAERRIANQERLQHHKNIGNFGAAHSHTSSESAALRQPPSPCSFPGEAQCDNCEDFHMEVISLLHKMLENQRSSWNTLNNLDQPAQEDIVQQAKSLADLEEVLQRIEAEPNYKKELISYLASIGGRNTTDIVRNIMSRIATPDIWQVFSFKQHRGKKRLDTFPIWEIVTKAAMKHENSDCTELKVNVAIADVLCNAKKSQ